MMPSDSKPRIRVAESTWKQLNARKQPGDTWDDVLQRVLADDGIEINE